jgi:hypothetical protein
MAGLHFGPVPSFPAPRRLGLILELELCLSAQQRGFLFTAEQHLHPRDFLGGKNGERGKRRGGRRRFVGHVGHGLFSFARPLRPHKN